MELVIKDLSQNYFGHSDSLHSITHTFSAGLNVVFGEVGSGKTTLLKVIAGIENQYNGSVELDGEVLPKGKNGVVSFVFDDLGFFERRSLRYNLDYPQKIRKMSKDVRKKAVDDIIETAGVSPNYLDTSAFRLPLEIRARTALARGFYKGSKIILLDNPLSHLDPSTRRKVFCEFIKMSANSSSIIVYATDSAEEVRLLDSPTLVLSCGYVAGCGLPDELIDSPDFLTPSELLIPYFNVFETTLTADGFDLFGKKYFTEISGQAVSFVDKKILVAFKPDAITFGNVTAKKLFTVNTDSGKIHLLDCNGLRCYSVIDGDGIDLDLSRIYFFDLASGRRIYFDDPS